MPKLVLPKFPPLDPKQYHSDDELLAELDRRLALTNAAWPDDLEVSDEELEELGYAIDITNDNEGISVFLGRGRSVKGQA